MDQRLEEEEGCLKVLRCLETLVIKVLVINKENRCNSTQNKELQCVE